MKPRTLLVLLVVVAGLGAFIWFYERELPSSEERAERAKKVLQLEQDEIDAVEIAWQGRTLRLERERPPAEEDDADGADDATDEESTGADETDDGGEDDLPLPEPESTWRIAKPLLAGQQARADGAVVARFLESLLGLEKARTLEEFEPKAVGLDKPRGTVTVETEDGKKVLSIGAPVPTGNRVIVGLADAEEAYAVDDAVLDELERAPGEWRDHEMLPGERGDITRITLRGGPGGPVALARSGETFRLAQPAADRADRDLVDSLLTDLVSLRAEEFLDGGASPAALGLQPPHRVVEVAFSGATPAARIELGPTDEATGLTAARLGRQLFRTRTNLVEVTDRAPRAWRSPAWSGLEVFEVDRARFTDAAGPVEVERAETDWKRGKDMISFTAVSDALFVVTGAQASEILTPAEARARGLALGKPTVTIAFNGGAPKGETLALYAPTAAGVPARASGRDVVLLLPQDKVGEVRERIADLRKAEALPPEEQQKDDAGSEEE